MLLIRGELLRRYPGLVIYAVKAVVRDGRRMLATDFPAGVTPPLESHPIFRGTLDADVTFVGFDLTRDEVARRRRAGSSCCSSSRPSRASASTTTRSVRANRARFPR